MPTVDSGTAVSRLTTQELDDIEELGAGWLTEAQLAKLVAYIRELENEVHDRTHAIEQSVRILGQAIGEEPTWMRERL